jgi:hypothetical protein
MGWGHIPARHAERIQQFYNAHLNPYLNYHRPCAQADVEVDAKGRKRRRYRRYQTPLETLLSLPDPQQYLRPGLTVATLKRISKFRSDTEAARLMQEAKRRLFEYLCKPALLLRGLAKACRKNYTLQNPGSCGSPGFRGVRRVVYRSLGGRRRQLGGPCNFNRGPVRTQHRGPAGIDPRRTGIVCAQRGTVEGEAGKQRKTFVGAGSTPSHFQGQRELSRLDCSNRGCRIKDAI